MNWPTFDYEAADAAADMADLHNDAIEADATWRCCGCKRDCEVEAATVIGARVSLCCARPAYRVDEGREGASEQSLDNLAPRDSYSERAGSAQQDASLDAANGAIPEGSFGRAPHAPPSRPSSPLADSPSVDPSPAASDSPAAGGGSLPVASAVQIIANASRDASLRGDTDVAQDLLRAARWLQGRAA